MRTVTVNLEQQKGFYDRYWENFTALSSYKIQRLLWLIETLLKIRGRLPSTDPKILDLGCGDGRLASFWNEITGAETYALDLSPAAIKNARLRYPFINYLEGDATQTPYENEMFDLVISQEVIEHITDQRRFLAECERITKPGGYLVLTTPNKFYFDRRAGGNYSNQPIENLIDKAQLYSLIDSHFKVLSFESLIFAKGDFGIYSFITNRYLLMGLSQLRVGKVWERQMLKKGYGLNLLVLCQKKQGG